MADWNYGNAFKKYPLTNVPYVFSDGNDSTIKVHNLFEPLPSFMLDADCIFVDPPWNIGNLNSFYTKAEICEKVQSFETFYNRLFECIREISPRVCYIEIGKDYLDKFIEELKKIYKYVNFYNSTYYHDKKNKCYVIRGSNKFSKPKLDDMDEEDIIEWICKNEDYNCIGDLCMGRGLVGLNAYRNNKKFVGIELNHKRLSVLIQRISENKIVYQQKTLDEATSILKATISDIQSGFMQIGQILKQVKEEKLYLQGNYKNISEYAKAEFNMSKSQTHGFIKVFNLYGNDERLKDYNYSSLLLLSNKNKSADEVCEYAPNLSKRQLSEILKNEKKVLPVGLKQKDRNSIAINITEGEKTTIVQALKLLDGQSSNTDVSVLLEKLGG